jgi:hypothetical protein
MPPVLDSGTSSSSSIPTSAHALQMRKEKEARQNQQSLGAPQPAVPAWFVFTSVAAGGALAGILLDRFVQWLRNRGWEKDADEESESDQIVDDDLAGTIGAIGRKIKHRSLDDEDIADLLESSEFLEFLETFGKN